MSWYWPNADSISVTLMICGQTALDLIDLWLLWNTNGNSAQTSEATRKFDVGSLDDHESTSSQSPESSRLRTRLTRSSAVDRMTTSCC